MTEQVSNEQASTEAQQSANLSIEHIFLLFQAVELAASRGAFKAAEMSSIGAAYDQVGAFLRSIEENQKALQDDKEIDPDAEDKGEDNE
jgi:hypothetical protein